MFVLLVVSVVCSLVIKFGRILLVVILDWIVGYGVLVKLIILMVCGVNIFVMYVLMDVLVLIRIIGLMVLLNWVFEYSISLD